MTGGLAETLVALEPTQSLRFPLAVLSLAELLLTTHAARFTGCIAIRPGRSDPDEGVVPGSDLLFLRQGSLVGLERVGSLGARGVADVLVQQGCLDAVEAEAFSGVAEGGVDLCRRLENRGLVPRRELDRAVAEHARRRLFERAGEEASMIDARAGIKALAYFHPVYIDPRPAIAFGFVVHGRAADKKAQMARVAGRRARLSVPYDGKRNAYGLPPPIIEALRGLGGSGIVFDRHPGFPSLSWSDAAGTLLLMDRIGLLEVEESAWVPGPAESSV